MVISGNRLNRGRAFALIFTIVLAGLASLNFGQRPAQAGDTAAERRAASGRFLILSDFHFDPFDGLTRPQFERLAAAPIDEWPTLLAVQPVPAYGRDAPAALVESCLADARERLPEPDFILCPGDFMAHGWQSKYDRLAARPRAEDETAFRHFTTSTMRFLAHRIRAAFPRAAFLPVLGNDDSYCGDYMIGPQSPYLAMCAEVFSPLLQLPPTSEELRVFRETISAGGYSSLRLPHLKQHRLIALNTIFFAAQYNNACGSSSATPALDQLAWLDRTLAAAQRSGETVWLLMHIPPGIDSFRTSQSKGSPQPFWQQELTARFLQLVRQHRSTIQIAFAGHTHMDDFRIIRFDGKPELLIKIAPAVSPIFRNNPGYHTVQYARETGAIETYETWYLPLPEKTPRSGEAGADATPVWRFEYDFRKTYGLATLNAAEVARLAFEWAGGGHGQQAYLQHYSVNGPPSGISIDVLSCAVLNITAADFRACARNEPPVKE